MAHFRGALSEFCSSARCKGKAVAAVSQNLRSGSNLARLGSGPLAPPILHTRVVYGLGAKALDGYARPRRGMIAGLVCSWLNIGCCQALLVVVLDPNACRLYVKLAAR